MSDAEALQLLRLLHKYVTEYSDATDMHISDMVEDIAMSMDETSNEADSLRKMICDVVGRG